MLEDFSEVIHNEPVTRRKEFAADDGGFPTGAVSMDAIQKGRVDIFLWKWFKEMGMLEHVRDGFLRVAHEDHRCLGAQLFDTARKGFVGHVVLHYVHEGLVHLFVFARELVEADTVPVTYKPDATVRVVHEEFRCRDLGTRNEDAVRRKLCVDVRFPRSFRPQLNEVVIVFAVGNEAEEKKEHCPAIQNLRVETDSLHQDAQPLIRCEMVTGFYELLEIDS